MSADFQLKPHQAGETTGTDERPPQRMTGTALAFDLAREVTQLHAERAWQQGADRIAKTLVKEPDLRLVLVALRAGGRIAEHRAAGPISIQILAGQVRLRTPGSIMDLPTGRLVSVERDVPHEVEALAESAFLLTIAWPSAQATAADGLP